MRHAKFTAALILLALLATAGGCGLVGGQGSGTEYQRIDQLAQLGTLAINTVSDLAEEGVIPPEKLKTIVPYADAFRAAIAKAEAAYEAGSRDTMNSDYRAAFDAATAAFEVIVKAKSEALKTKAAIDRVKAKPSTVPAPPFPPPTEPFVPPLPPG